VLEVAGDRFRIAVCDRGHGICPAGHIRLFQPGVTTKPAGNGFGLFLARRLVESRGGELTVESLRPTGTRFAVSLPIQQA
jgi:signal transduction histidine kinase